MDVIFTKLKIDRISCKHHVRGYFMFNGRKQFIVYYSFSKKDIPKFVVVKMAKAMFLDIKQFIRMGKCKISYDEYVEILRGKNVL